MLNKVKHKTTLTQNKKVQTQVIHTQNKKVRERKSD